MNAQGDVDFVISRHGASLGSTLKEVKTARGA